LSYCDAIQFLYGLRLFGLKLGLENPRRLAELSGNPQHRLRFIHVAGTNGKGSTCAMLESIYRAAGLRVGLFTSPHLVSFRERVQVHRQLISESEVVSLVCDMQELLRHFPAEAHPTFFEVVTVMALRHFAEQACELVIWETGLGGRLDATNIVTPLASVITNIAFDHERWLGDTLASIAAEKAGIIKPGVPVITGVDEPEALQIIRAVAAERKAPLTVVTPQAAHAGIARSVNLPLLGEHQRHNAAVAEACVRVLGDVLPVGEASLRGGLETVQWPGRLQVIRRGRQTLLLDGAHNAAGAESLRVALRQHFPGRSPALILGSLADKAWLQMCRILAPMAHRILLVPVQSARTAQPQELLGVCRESNPTVDLAACSGLEEALQCVAGEEFIVAAGSLYLVGEALELLGVGPVPGGKTERPLNEWQLSPTYSP
jgi:dihydrofolate synthase/folylpolyglutamate synthase